MLPPFIPTPPFILTPSFILTALKITLSTWQFFNQQFFQSSSLKDPNQPCEFVYPSSWFKGDKESSHPRLI